MFSSSRAFLPFSKSFIDESGFDQAQELTNSSQSHVPVRKSNPPASLPFKLLEAGEGRYVVSFLGDCSVYLSGYCKIICLKGRASIDGYFLSIGEEVLLRKSSWHPACQIRVNQGKALRKIKSGDKILNDHKIKLDLKDEQNCVLILPQKQLWLEEMDATPFKKLDTSHTLAHEYHQLHHKGQWKLEFQLLTDSYHLATESIYAKMKAEITAFPLSWDSAVYKLTESYLQHQQLKTVICGSKGVGKSSLLRYVINGHLNISGAKQSPICLIDCDLGQPELTVPGVVSLHLIDYPVISSHHLNLREPKISFFLGDITSRNEPENLCIALRQLFSRYQELRQEYIQNRLKEMQSKIKALNNPFSALLDDQTIEKGSEEDLQNCLPLVVNTDGYVRYMGAEILAAVIDIIQPSHILHVSSNQEPSLPLLQQMSATDPGVNIITLESPLLSTHTPNFRPVAAELRNLRLLSYFLSSASVERGNMSLKNASLTGSGNDGALSWSVLNQQPYIVPFHMITFNMLNESIVASQIFSVLNSSVVAISFKERVKDWPTASERTARLKIKRLGTSGNSSSELTQFYLHSLSPFCILPTEGLGVVRAVDLDRRCIILVTPVTIELTQQIVISVGSSLSLPYYMDYGDGFPTFPYYSSEFCGEGSSQLKPRTNLKRKGQEVH